MLIRAFRAAGLQLYNDVVFVRRIGTAALFVRNT